MKRIIIEVSGEKEREIAALVKKAARDIMKIYCGSMTISQDNGHDEDPPKVPDYVFRPRNERMGVLHR